MEPGRQADRPGATCELVFTGSSVRWLGDQGPDQGRANVTIDGKLVETVDAYRPKAATAQVLFEQSGLVAKRMHTLRIDLRRERHTRSRAG